MLDVTPIQSVLDIFSRLPFSWIPLNLAKKAMMDVLSSGPVPGHLGLIMDGNRRFAKKRGMGLKQGHTAGAESLSSILQCCFKLGIPEITVFAFSIENFSRPQEEIDDLFELLTSRLSILINSDESVFKKLKVRVKIIGNKALLPENIANELAAVEEKSLFSDSQKTLNICTPYTSRDDISNAIRTIAIKRKANGIAKEDINTKVLDDNMYFGSESRPLDILIRTSGHNRLSDFLLWQCTTKCSIEFVNTLWPDFKFLSLFLTLLKWSYYKQLEINDKKIYKPLPKPEAKFVDITMLPQSPPFASIVSREAN